MITNQLEIPGNFPSGAIAANRGLQDARSLKSLEIKLIFPSGWLFDFQQLIKRFLDLLIAAIALLLLFPILMAIGIMVRLDSPGPIMYKSTRIGKNYKPFKMYKFRTMNLNADSLRDELRNSANLQGKLFKIKDDPRITRIGKYLRAFSLDELPQLINVLKGEMSLVGPRPLPPDESGFFKEPYTLRYKITPGITGMWQVSGRSNLDFDKLCNLELSYLNNWNLFEDFKILLKTLPAVLLTRGAC